MNLSVITRPLAAACAFFCLAGTGAHASGPGTTAANFLKIPVGARGTALGGALTAAAEGADAVFYNPAGLGLGSAPELSYAYNNYFSGISQQWLAFSLPAGEHAWGLGLNYLSVKPFASYDVSDNRTGEVSAYDVAAYLGYARQLRTGLPLFSSARLGASVKYIRQELDSQSAAGYGAGAGLLLAGPRGLRLGFGAENLAASSLAFDGSGARPARSFKAGAAWEIMGAPLSAMLSADVTFPEDGASYVSAGVENTLYGLLALRAGYSSFGDISNGLNFGLGLRLPRGAGREVRLDYSYGATYDLGAVHKFAVSCRFGAPRARAEAAPAGAPVKTPAEEFSGLLEDLYGVNAEKAGAAAEALAASKNPRAMDHFAALLSSGKTSWKLTALRGLSACPDPQAPLMLEAALRDQETEVRALSARALAACGTQAQLPRLQEALKLEDSEEVKGALIEALGRIQGR
jgi:hypothetical protein